MNVSVVCSVITFIFFVIWIGLFTGLNLPEMKRMNDYFKTKCFVNASQIVRRYCPTKTCPDSCASTSASSCSSIQSQMEFVDPDQCYPNNPNSSIQCPITQTCDGGYYCCETYCTTYKDSNGHTHRSCHCSQSTSSRACTITPRLCFMLRLYINYNTTQGLSVWTTYDFDTNDDLSKAIELQTQKYPIKNRFSCFYDSTNLANIRWSISYTAGFWAASGIFAFFVFIGCWTSCSFFASEQDTKVFIQVVIAWFWVAIVLGLCLFLPLGLDPHIPEPSKTHMLRLAIVWTTMWTGFFLIYCAIVFDGFEWVKESTRTCLSICSSCCDRCLVCVGHYWTWFVYERDLKWRQFHEWGKRVEQRFCGCCEKLEEAIQQRRQEEENKDPPKYEESNKMDEKIDVSPPPIYRLPTEYGVETNSNV